MARYVFLYLTLSTAKDDEVWGGLDIPDGHDVTRYDELIPVAKLSPTDLARKRITVWHEVRGDVDARLVQLGLDPLPVM